MPDAEGAPPGQAGLRGRSGGTHVQDVAAAGQVAPVGQGRPAQVHAAFGSATRWSLAIKGETEATARFPCLLLTRQTARLREAVLLADSLRSPWPLFPPPPPQLAVGGQRSAPALPALAFTQSEEGAAGGGSR